MKCIDKLYKDYTIVYKVMRSDGVIYTFWFPAGKEITKIRFT